MADAITAAVSALTYKDADYTAVNVAIEKANALNKNDYRDFSAVTTAIDAVVRGKNITEQSKVDAMAKAVKMPSQRWSKKPSSGGGSSSGGSSSELSRDHTRQNGERHRDCQPAFRGKRAILVTITVKPDSGYQLDDPHRYRQEW